MDIRFYTRDGRNGPVDFVEFGDLKEKTTISPVSKLDRTAPYWKHVGRAYAAWQAGGPDTETRAENDARRAAGVAQQPGETEAQWQARLKTWQASQGINPGRQNDGHTPEQRRQPDVRNPEQRRLNPEGSPNPNARNLTSDQRGRMPARATENQEQRNTNRAAGRAAEIGVLSDPNQPETQEQLDARRREGNQARPGVIGQPADTRGPNETQEQADARRRGDNRQGGQNETQEQVNARREAEDRRAAEARREPR